MAVPIGICANNPFGPELLCEVVRAAHLADADVSVQLDAKLMELFDFLRLRVMWLNDNPVELCEFYDRRLFCIVKSDGRCLCGIDKDW